MRTIVKFWWKIFVRCEVVAKNCSDSGSSWVCHVPKTPPIAYDVTKIICNILGSFKLIEGFLTPVLHSDLRTWAVNYVLMHFSWDVPCWMPLSRGTIVKNMLQQKSSKLGHWMVNDQPMRDKHFPVRNQSLMPTSQAIALGPSIIRFTGTAGSCINFFPEWNFMLDLARHNCIANARFCSKPFFSPLAGIMSLSTFHSMITKTLQENTRP